MKSKSGVPYETIVQPYANGSNLQEGATVLMIDSQMFDNIVSYSGLFTQSHRIVYEGGLTFFNDNNESIRNVGNETELFSI